MLAGEGLVRYQMNRRIVHRVLLGALRGTPAQARAQVSIHLQDGAAELLRLRDLLAQRNERDAADAG